MDITLSSSEADIQPVNMKSFVVTLRDVDPTEVIEHLRLTDIIRHFGDEKLLDEIGIDEAKSHFGLKETEEE